MTHEKVYQSTAREHVHVRDLASTLYIHHFFKVFFTTVCSGAGSLSSYIERAYIILSTTQLATFTYRATVAWRGEDTKSSYQGVVADRVALSMLFVDDNPLALEYRLASKKLDLVGTLLLF